MKKLSAIFVALLAALQWRLWLGDGGVAEIARQARQIDEMREEIETIKTRNRMMRAEVEDLRQGTEALEERARTTLGMIREGEVLFRIIEARSGARRP